MIGMITNEPEVEKSCCSCGNECCSQESTNQYEGNEKWVTGVIKTPIGEIPQVSTGLSFHDTLGAWKARWGIGRMNYKIDPGLYCVGTPDNTSPILVTANYKLSFDMLRKELAGIDAWIMVLDTKGINVWCAAGKGTFGTSELVDRIAKVKLQQVVSHRTIILPQLGAPGVSAHEVRRQSGFKVVYGTVRAEDIRDFLHSGMKATPEMRTVKFTFYDRLVLTPMELAGSFKTLFIFFGILFILNLLDIGPFGIVDFYAYTGALFIGCVLTPVLLPWIPGRAFAWKGWILGILWAVTVNVLNGWPNDPGYSLMRVLAYVLVLPPISAFFAMNFTGASTYTSLSGVIKEMKAAIPSMIISAGLGIILIFVNSFM
jgi:hypothetical protein